MKIAVLKSQPRTGMALLLILSSVLLLPAAANGVTYRVGPGEEFSKVSEIADKLEAGDVVEITGDITDVFTLTAHGTQDKPITIRGVTRVEDGHIIRPRITAEPPAGKIIICKGDWTVLEGLDISGQNDNRYRQGAIIQECSNLVVRNCRIHHCLRAFCGYEESAGDVRFEFCEFYANGYAEKPPVSLYSNKPGATAIVEHCFFLDGTGGNFLRICMPRSVVCYNWFENPYEHALQVSTPPVDGNDTAKVIGDTILPAHCDIVGNVVVFGWGPGSPYCAFSLGGDSSGAPGTEGDFNIAHNLVLTRRGGVTPQVAVLVHGNVDKVNLYNNIFLEGGVRGLMVYSREVVWEGYRRQKFTEARGSGEPVVSGANNWITQGAMGIPETLENSLYGINPSFMNLVGNDFRPQPDSPLSKAGLQPLPKGQVASLVPECEPQRGVPADLRPVARRKVAVPSIGPFEASMTALPFKDDSADLVLGATGGAGRFAWPFDFGGYRRKSLEHLHNGDPEKALACAKMQFLLSPMDEQTLKSAVESVKQALILLEGNTTRADEFVHYAHLGEAGKDAETGTADDLANPLRDVELPPARKAQFHAVYDRTPDENASVGARRVTPFTSLDEAWRETQKALFGIESARFEDALKILAPTVTDIVQQPAGDIDGQKVMQRAQGIRDRIWACLTVVARARTGSSFRAGEYASNMLDFARYGPQGSDRTMGTNDDINAVGISGRGPLPRNNWSVERLASLRSKCKGNMEWRDVELTLNAAVEAEARTRYRMRLIASASQMELAIPLAFIGPEPGMFLDDLRPLLAVSDPKGAVSPKGDVQVFSNPKQEILSEIDDNIIEAFSAMQSESLPAESSLIARAYVSAYVGARVSGSGTSAEELIARLPATLQPAFVVEDLCNVVGRPFDASAFMTAAEEIEGGEWSREERERLIGMIERAQYESIDAERKRVEGQLEPDELRRAQQNLLDNCSIYLDHFPRMPRAPKVQFVMAFYELKTGQFELARQHCEGFIDQYPDSPLVPNVAFLVAVAMAETGDAAGATIKLLALEEKYPKSGVAARALYTAAYHQLRNRKYDEAAASLQRVVDFYHADPYAIKARTLLSKIEGTRGKQEKE